MDSVTKVHLGSGQDSPAQARAELAAGLDRINNIVDLLNGEPWSSPVGCINASKFDSLAAADAAAVSSGKLLLISTQWATVPSVLSAAIRVLPGGRLNAAGPLRITGPFEAGPYQVFTGPGPVTFGPASVRHNLSEWYGLVQPDLPSVIGLPPMGVTSNITQVGTGDTSSQSALVVQITSGTDTPAQVPVSAWAGGFPDQTKVGALIAGYMGQHSAACHNLVNPLLMLTPVDRGTCDVSGTAVTRLTGPSFRADWVGGYVTIGNGITPVKGTASATLHKISAVADASHMTLMTSAGTHTDVSWAAGMGGIAMEVDVNVSDARDADRWASRAVKGIIVAHGGEAGGGVALETSAAWQLEGVGWQVGLSINDYTEEGVFVGRPKSTTANGLVVYNGAAGSSTISGGANALVLTGAPSGLLRVTPSNDTTGAAVYGTNAANSVVTWVIAKDGSAEFETINTRGDIHVTNLAGAETTIVGGINALRLTGSSGTANVLVVEGIPQNLLRITPSDDTPGAAVYGTNAANSTVLWRIDKDGTGIFPATKLIPADDTPGKAIHGTDAAGTTTNWQINKDGATLFKSIQLTGVPVYADNAAATAGGMVEGQVYRTAAGALMIRY